MHASSVESGTRAGDQLDAIDQSPLAALAHETEQAVEAWDPPAPARRTSARTTGLKASPPAILPMKRRGPTDSVTYFLARDTRDRPRSGRADHLVVDASMPNAPRPPPPASRRIVDRPVVGVEVCLSCIAPSVAPSVTPPPVGSVAGKAHELLSRLSSGAGRQRGTLDEPDGARRRPSSPARRADTCTNRPSPPAPHPPPLTNRPSPTAPHKPPR
jgi:hypothetical protein